MESPVVEDGDKFVFVHEIVWSCLGSKLLDPLHHGHELVEGEGLHTKCLVEDLGLLGLQGCKCVGYSLQLNVPLKGIARDSAVEHWEALGLEHVLLLCNACEYGDRNSLCTELHPGHSLQGDHSGLSVVDSRSSNSGGNSKSTL